jgi:hypothetical protein
LHNLLHNDLGVHFPSPPYMSHRVHFFIETSQESPPINAHHRNQCICFERNCKSKVRLAK